MRLRCFAVALLMAAALPAAAAELVIAGSSAVQSRVLTPLAAEIPKATGVTVRAEGIGSGNGLKKLVAGEVPVAMVSGALDAVLKAANVADDGKFQMHEILEDVIVPIANARNPVEELTWEQLAGLYSGQIANWKEVSGTDQKVAVVTSHAASATREVVWEQVMGRKADYHRFARIGYSPRKEMVLVAENEGAVGAVSLDLVNLYMDEARKLGDPIEIKVIKSARITRPLGFITHGDPSPDTAKLLAYLRTPEARAKFK